MAARKEAAGAARAAPRMMTPGRAAARARHRGRGLRAGGRASGVARGSARRERRDARAEEGGALRCAAHLHRYCIPNRPRTRNAQLRALRAAHGEQHAVLGQSQLAQIAARHVGVGRVLRIGGEVGELARKGRNGRVELLRLGVQRLDLAAQRGRRRHARRGLAGRAARAAAGARRGEEDGGGRGRRWWRRLPAAQPTPRRATTTHRQTMMFLPRFSSSPTPSSTFVMS